VPRSLSWKRLLLVAWACALAFGLSFQATEAEAVHSSCNAQCKVDCGGSCVGAIRVGCSCYWACPDGSGGESTCVL